MEHKTVIIIGAGISGVKAAVDLYNAGVTNILILEARDRLGGRLVSVNSANNNNLHFDLGALWFHDALHNPLFDQALQLGNVDYYFDDGNWTYFSKDSASIPQWKFQAVADEIFAYMGHVYTENPERPDMTVKDACLEYVEKKKKFLSKDQITYAMSLVRSTAELWLGMGWDKVSAKSFGGSLGHLGRNVLVKSGYFNVFQNVLNELPKSFGEHIHTSEQVKHIDYTKKKVQVTTSAGFYTCDYVIVTVPQNLIAIKDKTDPAYIGWTPSLPPSFQKVLPEIEYGLLGKVILEFETCFWPENVDRFNMFTIAEPGENPQPWDYPVIILNYMASSGTPSLVALTQKPVSEAIENFDDNDRNNKIWDLFQPLLEKIAVKKAQKPTHINYTKWNRDIFARGSYAGSEVGKLDTDDIADVFAGGVNERVRFAGAETIKGSANGCAHGGWFTGQREAAYIIREIKRPSKI